MVFLGWNGFPEGMVISPVVVGGCTIPNRFMVRKGPINIMSGREKTPEPLLRGWVSALLDG